MGAQYTLGQDLTAENVGGKIFVSTYSEKLLGLYINSDFLRSIYVNKLSIELLKKRTGLLIRIRKQVPKEKIVTIAEAIFNILLRYSVCGCILDPKACLWWGGSENEKITKT